jgi:hypothetical protein
VSVTIFLGYCRQHGRSLTSSSHHASWPCCAGVTFVTNMQAPIGSQGWWCNLDLCTTLTSRTSRFLWSVEMRCCVITANCDSSQLARAATPAHLRMCVQCSGQGSSICIVPLHPDSQRLDAPLQEECCMRIQGATQVVRLATNLHIRDS